MDLYGRLEELQGTTRLLIDDMNRLHVGMGRFEPNPTPDQETTRRSYVRAVFALVEAFVEQHRRLLLDLADANFITLDPAMLLELREIKEILHGDGRVQQRTRYLRTFDKIKAVYAAAGTGFGEPLNITFGDQGFETFRAAMGIRDRLTHPKTAPDCWLSVVHLEQVEVAHDWFRTLQNEFVRVARAHREQHSW